MKTLRSKKRAAAKRCEELAIGVGDRIVIRGGVSVVVTAIGMTSVLVKPTRGEEKQIKEPTEVLYKDNPKTVTAILIPVSVSEDKI